jgi:ABC-type antimicrobial peptide transport system permease subunit
MAMGALPGRVLRQVLRETLWLASLGIVCGLPVAYAATRLLGGFLYGVKPGDPVVLLGSVMFLVTAAVLAGYIPAHRAARIDPVVALRNE